MSTLHKRFARKSLHGSKKENRPIQKSQSQQFNSSIFLDVTDQLQALYYLGLTYHLKAKEYLGLNNGILNDDIRNLLEKSIVYYQQNLYLNKELNDKVAEGRTLGNIGNVNYLLQDYSTSIEYLEKRLTIAKESNDLAGQRRAHGNLGNAYLYLEDFDKSLHHYREAMSIGELLNDQSYIARTNFTIGRVYSLKEDYDTAIYFHEKHLSLARQLDDSLGQCRAYYFLSQLNDKINQNDKAKKYDSLYKALAREIEQPMNDNISISGPVNHLVKNLRTDSISISLSEGGTTNPGGSSASSSHSPFSARSNASVNSSVTDVRSFTGSHHLRTDEKSLSNKSKKSKTNSHSLRSNLMHHFGQKKSPIPIRKESLPADHDELVELVCRMQKSRFEDQRCDLKNTHEIESVREHRPSAQLEDILNTVDRLQQFRLDDQRTNLPSPSQNDNRHLSPLNEQFFDQLSKCQDSRFDDQRTVLIPIHNHSSTDDQSSSLRPKTAIPTTTTSTITTSTDLPFKEGHLSTTLPDDDFFSLLNRLQSRRIDQQRTCLPSMNSPSKRTRVKQ